MAAETLFTSDPRPLEELSAQDLQQRALILYRLYPPDQAVDLTDEDLTEEELEGARVDLPMQGLEGVMRHMARKATSRVRRKNSVIYQNTIGALTGLVTEAKRRNCITPAFSQYITDVLDEQFLEGIDKQNLDGQIGYQLLDGTDPLSGALWESFRARQIEERELQTVRNPVPGMYEHGRRVVSGVSPEFLAEWTQQFTTLPPLNPPANS